MKNYISSSHRQLCNVLHTHCTSKRFFLLLPCSSIFEAVTSESLLFPAISLVYFVIIRCPVGQWKWLSSPHPPQSKIIDRRWNMRILPLKPPYDQARKLLEAMEPLGCKGRNGHNLILGIYFKAGQLVNLCDEEFARKEPGTK